MNEEIKYPSRQTIEKLTKELKLTGANEFTQDWECEVANVKQLPKFIDFYKNRELNINEKTTLMRIILESYNDLIDNVPEEERYRQIIKKMLINDYTIQIENIKYWACADEEDIENCFAITPLIREVSNNTFRGKTNKLFF